VEGQGCRMEGEIRKMRCLNNKKGLLMILVVIIREVGRIAGIWRGVRSLIILR